MPSLVETDPVVLEKKIFFNFLNVFSLICNYLPLEKGRALHLNKLESPSPKDALCQVDNNEDNDNHRQRTNSDQKSSLEPLAQVS